MCSIRRSARRSGRVPATSTRRTSTSWSRGGSVHRLQHGYDQRGDQQRADGAELHGTSSVTIDFAGCSFGLTERESGRTSKVRRRDRRSRTQRPNYGPEGAIVPNTGGQTSVPALAVQTSPTASSAVIQARQRDQLHVHQHPGGSDRHRGSVRRRPVRREVLQGTSANVSGNTVSVTFASNLQSVYEYAVVANVGTTPSRARSSPGTTIRARPQCPVRLRSAVTTVPSGVGSPPVRT